MRRKKLPSRKRQALWRVLLALVSLLLVDHIFGIALLPIQAVRREAEHEGIGRAWVVERKWEPSLYKTHLFYLMENERAVMLGDTHLSPLGWGDDVRSYGGLHRRGTHICGLSSDQP